MWSTPREGQHGQGHAALAARLRAAHGGLPGLGGLLGDPLPRLGPQWGRGGGHHQALGGDQKLELHVWPALREGD